MQACRAPAALWATIASCVCRARLHPRSIDRVQVIYNSLLLEACDAASASASTPTPPALQTPTPPQSWPSSSWATAFCAAWCVCWLPRRCGRPCPRQPGLAAVAATAAGLEQRTAPLLQHKARLQQRQTRVTMGAQQQRGRRQRQEAGMREGCSRWRPAGTGGSAPPLPLQRGCSSLRRDTRHCLPDGQRMSRTVLPKRPVSLRAPVCYPHLAGMVGLRVLAPDRHDPT